MKLNSLVWTVIVVFLLTFASTNAQLQPPYFVDDFEDGSAEDDTPVTWQLAAPYDTGTAEVINGDYVLTPPNTATPLPGALKWSEVDSVVAGPDFREVSVYTQLRVLGSGNEYAGVFARGTYAPTGEATSGIWGAIRPNGQLEVGTWDLTQDDWWRASSSLNSIDEDIHFRFDVLSDRALLWAWGEDDQQPSTPQLAIDLPGYVAETGMVGVWSGELLHGVTPTPVAYRFFEAAPISLGLDGDFNRNNELDIEDIDLLTAEILSTPPNLTFDLNDDGDVSQDDRDIWVNDLKNTYFGDSNLDGEFNTGDVVQVLQAGKYETQEPAGWGEGDWDGSGFFDTGDLVFVLALGGYEEGPKDGVSAVPEPSSCILAWIAIVGLLFSSRKQVR